jgi:hypothetical protein
MEILPAIVALLAFPTMFLSVCSANFLLTHKDAIQRFAEEFNVGSDYAERNKFGE